MPLTTDVTMTLSLSLLDRDRNISTLSFSMANGGLLAILDAAITGTIIPAVEAITDALVIGYTLSSGAHDYAPGLPPESSDVERKGVFSFRAANGASYVVAVPSFRNTMVIDRTNQIDLANASVVAFVNMITDGAVLGIASTKTYLGSDIVGIVKAVKKHRGSGVG